MDRGAWLKAGGLFLASLTVAAGLGLGLAALSPRPDCGFPVHLERRVGEGGFSVTVVRVDGVHPAGEVAYRVVLLDAYPERILEEGTLAEARDGTQAVTYLPEDGVGGALQAGDAFQVEAPGDAHLLLLEDGVPLGWTAGCEV